MFKELAHSELVCNAIVFTIESALDKADSMVINHLETIETIDKGFSVTAYAIKHQAVNLTSKAYRDLFKINPTLKH